MIPHAPPPSPHPPARFLHPHIPQLPPPHARRRLRRHWRLPLPPRLESDFFVPATLWTALLSSPNPSLSHLLNLIITPLTDDQTFRTATAHTAMIDFQDQLEAWNKIPRDRRCPRPRPSHPP